MDLNFKIRKFLTLQNSRSLRLRTICLTFLIYLNLSLNLYAQINDIEFECISLEQGLSQTTVWAIMQDSKGFMWFGTADGLNKYDGYSFTIYNHDPLDSTSISENRIIAIYEDKSGTLWIGTDGGGLNRLVLSEAEGFDRETEKFTHYQNDPSNPNSLSDNHILSIHEDKAGALWIGTEYGGFNRFDRETERFEPYKHDPLNPNSLSSNHIVRICEDKTGVLWIGTNNGLNKFDKEHEVFTHYQNDPTVENSLSHNQINAIYEDKSGTVWIGTDNGLNKVVQSELEGYDKTGVKFVHYNHNPMNPNSLSDSTIWSIYEDKSGTLWIGTAKGGLNKLVLSEVEGSDKEIETFVHYKNEPYDPNSLSNNGVRCIFEDCCGVLWIGTNGGGLNKFNRFKEKFVHYKNDPNNLNSLSNNRVYAFCQDKAGLLWIGTTRGGGLNKFDREKGTFFHYKSDPSNPYSLSHDNVISIYEDRFEVIWIGTFGGGLNKFDRETKKFEHFKHDPVDTNSLSDNVVRIIFEDQSGTLWIGTDYGGLNKFDREKKTFRRYNHDPQNDNSLSNNSVRAIYEDHSGALWIGTYGGGLNRFDRSSERFMHYKHDPANPKSLSHNNVLSIYEDPTDGGSTLWIGTYGGGLNKLVLSKVEGSDRIKVEFTYFTKNVGLPNNIVYGILSDDQGNLWLSTNKGLSKFNPQTETFINYDVNDGLQSNEFNTGAYYKSSSGEMFFGGINGFNAFYPDRIDNPYIPPVVITKFKKFSKIVRSDISDTEEIELSYRDNYLSFEFVALDYTNPQQNQYRYRMEGFDEDWIDAGTRRFATYTNLDPGEYVFKVKGSNSDGKWNEQGVSIKIIIKPPFWKTWWFIILSAMFLTVIGYTWIRQRVHEKIEKARILNELTAAHDTQMGLMPTSDPTIEGFDISGVCKPAEAVGGDFFDYLWVDEERTKLGIAIVDVSEKAMKGAMNAVMTSGMVYSEVGCGESPRLFLQRINKAQYLKTDSHVFTTMLYGVLDIKNKIFIVSNAGHPQPILKRDDRILYIKGEKNHLPLGVQQDMKYTEEIVKLQSGDMLFLYTDGLPEAMNEKNKLFDFERIESTIRNIKFSIPATEILNTLLNEVEVFTGMAQQNDDITIVVLKVE
ncbi:MAG: SpoIIE family protein phosphatase [bacterium]|nr:MAG: SpoIIE family protein phosphatase [bacterium]